jgi:hypothetical protein
MHVCIMYLIYVCMHACIAAPLFDRDHRLPQGDDPRGREPNEPDAPRRVPHQRPRQRAMESHEGQWESYIYFMHDVSNVVHLFTFTLLPVGCEEEILNRGVLQVGRDRIRLTS